MNIKFLLCFVLAACFITQSWAQTPPPVCEDKCTLTQGYWKNHHSEKGTCPPAVDCTWPICPETGVTAELSVICLLNWRTIIATPTQGSAWFILAHQYIAASLNLKDGRCAESTSAVIISTLAAAKEKLEICSLMSASPSSPMGTSMVALARILDDYNNGLVGPEHCEDDGGSDPGTGDDDDDEEEPCDPQNCGARTCRIVEICEFETPPVCDGDTGMMCCECENRTFEDGCCTRTRGYWSTHNAVVCPGPPPPKTNCTATSGWVGGAENNLICENTAGVVSWVNVFNIPNNAGCPNNGGNAWNQLAAQWVAASLNVLHNEVCVTIDIAQALNDATALLEANCVPRCIVPGSTDAMLAEQAKNVLDAFNNGEIGPGHCGDQPCGA